MKTIPIWLPTLLVFVNLKSWEGTRVMDGGKCYLYLAENDKMLSSYFFRRWPQTFTGSENQISGEIWSPRVGNSALGPLSSLPTARSLDPQLLLRKISFWCNKIICLGVFFLISSMNWQIPKRSLLLPSLWLIPNTHFLSGEKSWTLCCLLFSPYLSSLPLPCP